MNDWRKKTVSNSINVAPTHEQQQRTNIKLDPLSILLLASCYKTISPVSIHLVESSMEKSQP